MNGLLLQARFVAFTFSLTCASAPAQPSPASGDLRVGAAAVELEADNAMVIAGGIHAGKARGQEGKLRCVAVVLEKPPAKLAIVACDVLMLTRQTLDPAVAEVEKATGIPAAHILVNATHTHHAPSTMAVHDYGPDEAFTRRVQQGLVQAVPMDSWRLLLPARLGRRRSGPRARGTASGSRSR